MSSKNAAWGTAAVEPDRDLQLVRGMARGDVHALDKLYALYGSDLLIYLSSRLRDGQWAEEVLQDVMLAAWRGAAGFRGESRVYTWLISIARNRALNALQRNAPPPGLPLDPARLEAPGSVEGALEQKDQWEELQTGIDELPPEQRETLELVFFHGLSYQETAGVLEISPGTVKSRLSRAKANLRRRVQEKG